MSNEPIKPQNRTDHELVVRKVLWLVAHRNELMFETSPGPAFQFYPDRWLADLNVTLMSFTARAMHLQCMCFAWREQVPCSLGADQMQALCSSSAADSKAVLNAWFEYEGRYFQIGLCRSYLDQVKNRIKKVKAAAGKGKNTALQEQCSVTAAALEAHRTSDLDALHLHRTCSASAGGVQEGCKNLAQGGSPTLTPSPVKESPSPPARMQVEQTDDEIKSKSEFKRFFSTYPNKVNKLDAQRAWHETQKIRPPIEKLIAAVERNKASPRWRERGGRYIPKAANFLRDGGWSGELLGTEKPSKTRKAQLGRIEEDDGEKFD